MDLFGNLVGDFGGAFPHGVVGHRDLVLLVGIGPLGVFLHDLQRVVAPDRAVRRGDDVELEVHAGNFLQFFRHHHGERVEDIGVVFHRLFPEQALVGLVVEEFFHRKVLTEGVVGEEDVVVGHVGGH